MGMKTISRRIRIGLFMFALISVVLLSLVGLDHLLHRHSSVIYYGTLHSAVEDINNGTVGDKAQKSRWGAVAAIDTDEHGAYIVKLLKDIQITYDVPISADMTICLNGHTLSGNCKAVLDILEGNVIIDGQVKNSAITNHRTDGGNTRPIQVRTGRLTILGGTYTADLNSADGTAIGIMANATIEIKDATIAATNTAGTAQALQLHADSTQVISNCQIVAEGRTVVIGINNRGTAKLLETHVTALSDYAVTENGDMYAATAIGIQNYPSGTLTLENCNVSGIHSGVQNQGTLSVTGGIYEGYGHGGFYFSGDGTQNTAHVHGAIIRQCAMPTGYEDMGAETTQAGFYIGGSKNSNHIRVYLDGCDIYGAQYPFVLRGTSGETDNALYISNSKVNLDGTYGIRLDNPSHKLYIGTGCNFDASHVKGKPGTDTDVSDSIHSTNESYP